MEMTSISKAQLISLRARLAKYAEAIGRIKATLDYQSVSPIHRLARIETIIEEAEL
mgnify:FL=1